MLIHVPLLLPFVSIHSMSMLCVFVSVHVCVSDYYRVCFVQCSALPNFLRREEAWTAWPMNPGMNMLIGRRVPNEKG